MDQRTDVPHTKDRIAFSRADCLALDEADPLKACRARFDLPDGVVYLDGNSLGALPRTTAAALQELVAQAWGRDLIKSWTQSGWTALASQIGACIAALIGAGAHEVVAADSTSVIYYKLARAALALNPGRRVVVAEAGDFPTNAYILQGLAQTLGDALELRVVERERVAAALDGSTALLALTHVHYRTGARHDMAALTAVAHDAGALTLWDLSHSAGAFALDLTNAGADLAVGCGYKYLNGGPGAPAFLYVAERLHDRLASPIAGWFGHADPFAFSQTYEPAPGVARMLSGTPPVLGLSTLLEGVKTFDGVSMSAVEAKSRRLGQLFLALVQDRCAGLDLTPDCPLDADQRGSQFSLLHRDAGRVMAALIERGVIGDFRPPQTLRFGLTPLYTRYVDIWDAVDQLRTTVRAVTG